MLKTLSPALEVVFSDSVLFCINIEPVLVHLEEVPRDLFMVRIREASRGVHGRCYPPGEKEDDILL
jgi:hypothetical protein